ncbi:hypothetical protein BGX23_001673 [Mortierella sp. AD031]|nr:hypothetical protein BGX23_001673 [Mortierella sp. AD031]
MLHSEDLSVTEFAKLAGITILPEVDDSITYEEAPVNIANEIHEHHRRGSSAELSVGLDCAGAGGAGVAGSAGNTLNSGVSLTVGSSGSERGGSRKTNIWDPQFWSDPVVRDGTTKVLLPSTSTASLPIPSGSGSFAPWRKYPPVPVRSSAPSSPKLQPQIRANCIQTTASLARLGNGGRGSTVPFGSVGGSSQQEQQQQRRRNSCSPAVLMPAAGSRTAAAAAGGGCEIDRARQCTPSDVSSSSKRVDQQQPRPPNNKQDTIQLSQDLGRRRSFTSLTAVALELEGRGGNDTGQQPVGGGGSGSSLERGTVWDHSLQGGGGAGGGLLVGDPVTATTRSTQQYIPPPQSMSHTLAMNALQTPRSRGSVTGGSSGHSSNSGLAPGGGWRRRDGALVSDFGAPGFYEPETELCAWEVWSFKVEKNDGCIWICEQASGTHYYHHYRTRNDPPSSPVNAALALGPKIEPYPGPTSHSTTTACSSAIISIIDDLNDRISSTDSIYAISVKHTLGVTAEHTHGSNLCSRHQRSMTTISSTNGSVGDKDKEVYGPK